MNKLEEIKKHIMLINDILLQENKEKKEWNKVRIVYWLDSVWVLDRDTIKLFYKREDAYNYYKDLAMCTLDGYKKNNDRLKRVNAINDFTEYTYFLDNDYPEFWIDNKSKWNCHMWFEYEECILEECFIS